MRESGAIQLERALRLFRKIGQIGHGRLHAIGHLILRDARRDLRIAIGLLGDVVQLAERVEHRRGGAPASMPVRIREEQNRIAGSAEPHALIFRRQKPARPEPRKQRLIAIQRIRLRNQHDERGKILIFAAEPIADPRAHARAARLHKAGLDESNRRIVIDRVGIDGLDDA